MDCGETLTYYETAVHMFVHMPSRLARVYNLASQDHRIIEKQLSNNRIYRVASCRPHKLAHEMVNDLDMLVITLTMGSGKKK